MDLTIITVTYHSREYIDACIMSVVTSTLGIAYEHIIVDNASTDGTVELIESGYLQYVRLIKNQQNVGFAAANNQAALEARGRYVLFLNPDMRVHKGYLDTLINWMDKRPEIGLSSCQLLSHDEQPHPALRPMRFPSLFPYVPALMKLRPFFCSVHPRFFYPDFQDELEQEVEVVRGAFMLVRKEIVEMLGFAFDPQYFILFEDIDLCREVKRLGYKVVYTPQVSCVDYFGRSFLSQTRAWKYRAMTRSFMTYVRKWHHPVHLLWLRLLILLGFVVRIPEWGIREVKNAVCLCNLRENTKKITE